MLLLFSIASKPLLYSFSTTLSLSLFAFKVIDFRAKTIKYLDSMAEPSNHKHVLNMLEVLREYLKEEHNDKKKSAYDVSDWKLLNTGKVGDAA